MMTFVEVGAHLGGIADEVLVRARPTMAGTARLCTSYVRRLRPVVDAPSLPSAAHRGRVVADELRIVPRELTRC